MRNFKYYDEDLFEANFAENDEMSLRKMATGFLYSECFLSQIPSIKDDKPHNRGLVTTGA